MNLSPFPHSPSISSPFPHSLPISSQPGCKAAAGCDSLYLSRRSFRCSLHAQLIYSYILRYLHQFSQSIRDLPETTSHRYETKPALCNLLPHLVLGIHNRYFKKLCFHIFILLRRPCACGVPHIPEHQNLLGHEKTQVCFRLQLGSNYFLDAHCQQHMSMSEILRRKKDLKILRIA